MLHTKYQGFRPCGLRQEYFPVFIVCIYKGKGDALDRGNYQGLKLTKQAMKILERIVDGLIRPLVSIDNSQFGLSQEETLQMQSLLSEKASDRVPRKVIWWALRKLGVDEWIVRLVQGMYANA